MPRYEVRVMEPSGVRRHRVEASDRHALAAVLGVAPQAVLGASEIAEPEAGAPRTRRAFPLRLFSKELAVLLGAGIPLLEAVTTLREKEASAASAAALESVEQQLRAGASFSAALACRPDVFDALFVAIASSAERTGQLREALHSHAEYLAWVETLRARLVSACVYPLLLVGVGAAVVLFLLVYVVPRFAGLLDGLSGDIPAASRALLALGQWTGAHPLASAALAAALLAAPVLAWQQPVLRAQVQAALWRLPLVAGRLRLLALARLYRTLAMLLAAGVAMVPALRIARAVVAAPLQPALEVATGRVERGERLSDALQASGLATPVSLRMVRVGERSGGVGTMLGDAAAFYDEELARLTELVTRLINPLLMLLMGGVIGTVVVLLYLPIFQLMEGVQ